MQLVGSFRQTTEIGEIEQAAEFSNFHNDWLQKSCAAILTNSEGIFKTIELSFSVRGV
jgi:hypothetical protein